MFIRSRRVVLPESVEERILFIENGKIAGILHPHEVQRDDIIDVGNLAVSPGIVDSHVHVNEPGRTEWEGFDSVTRGAAAGGVTTIVDMPLNSSPVTTTREALGAKLSASEKKLHVDCGFYGGLVPANAASITPLLKSGILGVKAFLIHSGIDDFPNVSESDVRTAMPMLAESGLPLLVHCELESGDGATTAKSASNAYSRYLESRPSTWETNAIALMVGLCEEFHCRVHIVHVSSSESVSLLREAKHTGLPITAETCPHYLCFAGEDIPDGATEFKCAPPIRSRENNEALWSALEEGTLDMIASDHSPCPPEMKQKATGDFIRAWGGIASLQWSLPAVWTECRKRGYSLLDLQRWMSHGPARLAGLEKMKGRITIGYDADVIVWDPDEEFVVDAENTFHRHKLTPYAGRRLFGRVHNTFLRGTKVYDRGEFVPACGKAILRSN